MTAQHRVSSAELMEHSGLRATPERHSRRARRGPSEREIKSPNAANIFFYIRSPATNQGHEEVSPAPAGQARFRGADSGARALLTTRGLPGRHRRSQHPKPAKGLILNITCDSTAGRLRTSAQV